MKLSFGKFVSNVGTAGALSAIALMFGASGQTFAAVGAALPTAGYAATVTAAGQEFTVPITIDPKTGIATVQNFTGTFDGGTFSIGNLTLNPDPGIIFGVSATNNSNNPVVFSFGFSTPLAPPLSGTIDAKSSIGYTLTDGFLADTGGVAGVTLDPFFASGTLVGRDFPGSVDKGVDVGPSAIGGAGTCGAFVGATSNCGPYAATNTFFSATPLTTMGATVSFLLSAHDAAGLSGSLTQTQVIPEPSTYALLAAGLAFVGFVARRRLNA